MIAHFLFSATATAEVYTLSLHDALQVSVGVPAGAVGAAENALDPVRLLDAVIAALFAIRIVAEHGHDGVGLV